MQTSVTIGLWLFYIICNTDKLNIVLRLQKIFNSVNIFNIRADDTNPCDIIQIFPGGLDAQVKALAVQFFNNALGRFYSGLDGVNWVALMGRLKLVIQNLKLRTNLLNRCCEGILQII